MADLATLRQQVLFAITPHDAASAAIDGDAYSVSKMGFYSRSVPFWANEIEEELLVDYAKTGFMYFDGADQDPHAKGVPSLSFHVWVAEKVKAMDPAFHYEPWPLSRGRQAREIERALREWAQA